MGSLVALLAVVGYSAAPFAIADSNVNAAVIAGVFSTVNVCIQLWNARQNRRILAQAKTNAQIALETGERVGVVHQTARQGVEELADVKRKVSGERRRGGERRGDDERRHDD